MKMYRHRLANPFFISSLLLLIVNDWVLKTAFGNAVTGKLSDVAGLFAAAYFFSALLPTYKTTVHVATAILFIVWKTPLAEPLLGFLNHLGIPAFRTVDYTDYLTLPAIALSWHVYSSKKIHHLNKWAVNGLLVLAPLAFAATSQAPSRKRSYEINKEYHFDYPRRDLIARINALQLSEMNRVKRFYEVDFDSEANIFHTAGIKDTLVLLLDPDATTPQDTIHYKSAFAYIQISGDETQSTLALINAYLYEPRPNRHRKKQFTYAPLHRKYTPEAAVKLFEKRVVRKLKKKPQRTNKTPMDNMTSPNELSALQAIKLALLEALLTRQDKAEYRNLATELQASRAFTDSKGNAYIGAWRLDKANGEFQLQRQVVSDHLRISYTAFPRQQNSDWVIDDIRRTIVHRN